MFHIPRHFTRLEVTERLRNSEDLPALISTLYYDMNTGEFTWNFDIGTKTKAGDIAGGVDRGSLYITIAGIKYQASKLAYFYLFGFFPTYIGFVDGDPLNIKFNNLEIISRGEAIKRKKELNKHN